jgi:hypothetical protein
LAQLLLTSGDCAKLMPDGSPAEAARVAELEAHMKVGKGWAATEEHCWMQLLAAPHSSNP